MQETTNDGAGDAAMAPTRRVRATRTRVLKAPPPVLKPRAVYFGDNGRAICRECAGQSAKYTGRDLSGHRVERATVDDCREWEQVVGAPLACEMGCTTLSTVAGSDGWPLAVGGVE
jgi:hypothetical protein